MRHPGHRVRQTDAGITLVELLIYSVLMLVVLTLVGTILYRALVSQRDVRDVTDASNAAQLVSASFERGVRNASKIAYTTSAGDELLAVRARVGSSTAPSWACEGWFYDASALTLYTKTVPAAGAPNPAITAPVSTADYATWTTLARGLSPRAPSTAVFTPDGLPIATVDLNISVAAGQRRPVVIVTQATKRPQGSTESAPCF